MNPQLRQTDREKIATDTAEYLARGGVIEILPPWVARNEYQPSDALRQVQRERGRKASRG